MTPIEARKKKTLAKLGWVCAKIEEILAGQDVTLKDVKMPHEKEPGESVLERLQRFKGLLNETLTQINSGQERTCKACQGPLPDVLLDDMPWIWNCPACTK